MSEAHAPATGPIPLADADERTRDRVRSAVLEHGPISAAQLGTLLGLTPAAVRRHLDTLSKNGVIEVKLVSNARSGAGRPARRYVLSRRGQSAMGNDYLDIARTALTQLAEAGGEEAITAFAEHRFAKMEQDYRPIVNAAGDDISARSKALATALSGDGFVASSASFSFTATLAAEQLCQAHCPVQELAASFPQFCDAETAVFSRLLGTDVRRLSTLASGGHVCTTHIPTGRSSSKTTNPSTSTTSNPSQERP
ncbi:helix-turn-helix transcriptional regulator [Pseudarthrobacter sp. P1]|uniref:helix-turn-helix transcriptional regulator n=1 Tax=Pseudarthrobacter sp. P1 TaxID=3418418 RepID=UPI003CF88166